MRLVGRDGKPLFRPGRSYHYSNTNYLILGLIAERVTGQRWSDLVRRRFFAPLGLRSTYVYGEQRTPPTAAGYQLSCAVSPCTTPELRRTDGSSWAFAWSAGAIVTNATDMARWLRALIPGTILDAAHRRLMRTVTPQSETYWRTQSHGTVYRITGYGLGLYRYRVAGVGTGWGHSGEISGFTNDGAYFPKRRLAVVGMTNIQGAYKATDGIGLGQYAQAAVRASGS